MEALEALSHHAPLEAYEEQAHALWSAFKAGDDDAAWPFKWEHPRFRGKHLSEVKKATLSLEDAQLVIAHIYAFDTWRDLKAFTRALKHDPKIEQFESAVQAIVDGDLNSLNSALQQHPKLVTARSSRRHHATLLHYIAANGVEGSRQRTPANAVAIAKCLLDAGAEADALADMYGGRSTTMAMLVSSAHPAEAGVQAPLAELLLEHGANPQGAGSQKQSPILIALAFGYSDTAQALARRAPPKDDLVLLAGLGQVDETMRLLDTADAEAKQKALALAAQHGHTDVVKLLLDAGLDPNRYNPTGFHPHSTPLHQAVWSNHAGTVRLLVERGARLDIQDRVYNGTPLDWAVHSKRDAIADYLRSRTA